MHFSRDYCVVSVLTKTPGAFLGGFAARRAKTRDSFCPILIHKFVYLQLFATFLWLTLRASLRLFKIVPDDFVSARCLLVLYVQDVRYAGFAGAKIGHTKITIF